MWHVTIAGLLTGHAQAADFVKTGLCLAQNCKVSMHCPVVTALPARWCITLEYHLPLQAELANCLADGQCRENLICLQNCNGREDESQCQVSHTA